MHYYNQANNSDQTDHFAGQQYNTSGVNNYYDRDAAGDTGGIQDLAFLKNSGSQSI